MRRCIVFGLALGVALAVLGRWGRSRWRAYGDTSEMRMRAEWE